MEYLVNLDIRRSAGHFESACHGFEGKMDLCLLKPCDDPEGAGCALCVHEVNVVLRIDWERRRKSLGWLRAGPLKDAFHRAPPGRAARSGDKLSMSPATLVDEDGHGPPSGQFSRRSPQSV